MRFRMNREKLVFGLSLFVMAVLYGTIEILSQGVAVPKRAARALPKVKIDIPLPKIQFEDIAPKAGLTARHVTGGDDKKYILETTGSGVALFDYDNDGYLDIFLVNGTMLEGFAQGQEPTSHLYHNNKNGTFTDVTQDAKLLRSGWGQGACVGDYDNDGYDDLFVVPSWTITRMGSWTCLWRIMWIWISRKLQPKELTSIANGRASP